MMETEFRPYEKKELFKCELSKNEALLIQKIRDIGFGSVKVHLSGGEITRTETIHSELMKDKQSNSITIATETIIESK